MARKNETDEFSHFMVGTMVKLVEQESFFSNSVVRNYVEFQVEGTQRFKI